MSRQGVGERRPSTPPTGHPRNRCRSDRTGLSPRFYRKIRNRHRSNCYGNHHQHSWQNLLPLQEFNQTVEPRGTTPDTLDNFPRAYLEHFLTRSISLYVFSSSNIYPFVNCSFLSCSFILFIYFNFI